MGYQIEVKVHFRYGHRLLHPYVGKCNNVHGEGGTAIFIFETNKLDENGMVADFGDIKNKLKKWIDDNLDHAYIHHVADKIGDYLRQHDFKTFVMTEGNPTAELLAKLLYRVAYDVHTGIKRVGVVESFSDSVAWYQVKG